MAAAHGVEHAVGGRARGGKTPAVHALVDAVEQKTLAQPARAGEHDVAPTRLRIAVGKFLQKSLRLQQPRPLAVLLGHEGGVEGLERLRALSALLPHRQTALEAGAKACRRIAHIAGIAADGAAVVLLQIVLGQPQRPQAAARFGVEERALLAHIPGNGAALLRVRLVHGRAQRLRRQRHAARAQGFQFRITREGLALAFALLALVLVALTRVFIQQRPHALRSGHSPFPLYCVRSVNNSSPSPSIARCS